VFLILTIKYLSFGVNFLLNFYLITKILRIKFLAFFLIIIFYFFGIYDISHHMNYNTRYTILLIVENMPVNISTTKK
jgi:hypothetical protein